MMSCIHGEVIYTGKGIQENAYLIVSGKRITGLSKAKKGKLLGEYSVITPAFIDAHSHIGMERMGEPAAEGEANEHMDSLLILPDALDSVQMDDQAFADAVEMGALYSCVVPGSGNVLGGRSAVIRNYAKDTTSALIARAGLKAAFGYNPMSKQNYKGTRPSTRMGAISLLRKRLDEVRQRVRGHRAARGKKKREITFSAEEAVLRDVLAGKERLRAHCHKIDDIAALLRLVDEFKLKVTVEHAADVHQPEILRELKRRHIPVVFGPIDTRASKVELKHKNWRNIRHFVEVGVQFGFMTDHPVTLARNLLAQTRWLSRAGLSKEEIIGILSRRNAEILGIDNILGTLEKGKWASFTCWNGDPFDQTNYPVAVYGEGEEIALRPFGDA